MFRQLIGSALLGASFTAFGVDESTDGVPIAEEIHLTGVFGTPDLGYVGIVEYPDGRLLRVRAGEMLDEEKVEEVTPKWIRLQGSGGDAPRTLWLKGAEKEVVVTPGTEPGNVAETVERRGQDSAASVPRGASQGAGAPVPKTGVSAAGAEGESKAEAGGRTEAPLPGEKSMPELADEIDALDREALAKGSPQDIGGVLGPMLCLPEDAQVVSVDDRRTGNLSQGLSHVENAARQQKIIRLTVETGGQRQRVMLMPGSDEGAPARVVTFGDGPATSAGRTPVVEAGGAVLPDAVVEGR